MTTAQITMAAVERAIELMGKGPPEYYYAAWPGRFIVRISSDGSGPSQISYDGGMTWQQISIRMMEHEGIQMERPRTK
jgi:hypothetical protein